MKFLSFSLTDAGLKRKNNEDALIDMPGTGLFAVADGMGGEQYGEVASETAVTAVKEHVKQNRAVMDAYSMSDSQDNRKQVQHAGRCSQSGQHEGSP